MRIPRTMLALLALSVLLPGLPAAGEEPTDGRNKTLLDPFLDNLVGEWSISRRVRDTQVQNTMKAEWVLQHQFLQLHMKDPAQPPQYEALVLIGYSRADKRYVAHWCDNFGGKFSAMGYGTRSGNSIEFVFQYPDGPFHNTFSWNPETHGWTSLMESEGKDGKRTFFAEDSIRRP